MSRYTGEANYQHNQPERLGVLMVNLGTPDEPTPSALRRYLAEFLGDPRVVETSRAIWLPILHGVILRTRPRRSAKAYATVWEETGSPLLSISVQQHAALQQALDPSGENVHVTLAMRYGNPSVAKGLAELRDAGCRRVLVLPMYPQYAGATTATVFDAVTAELQKWRWIPELRFINEYAGDNSYIDALAKSTEQYWAEHGNPERLLMSFHGIPKEYFMAGDPYHCQCHKTGRLLADRLGLADGQWQVTFQSRFGPREWLQPYTDATLKAWGAEKLSRVDVICPGFSADCLETLEEIGVENREYFTEAGGGEFHYIPALNDRPEHIEALAKLVKTHMQGWPTQISDDKTNSDRQQRATDMGAKQ